MSQIVCTRVLAFMKTVGRHLANLTDSSIYPCISSHSAALQQLRRQQRCACVSNMCLTVRLSQEDDAASVVTLSGKVGELEREVALATRSNRQADTDKKVTDTVDTVCVACSPALYIAF